MIKNLTLLTLFVIISCPSIFSQDSQWANNLNSSQSFIENKGQFDGRNWDSSSEIEFAYAQNPFYIFFSKKGLTYRFDKIVRNPNRDKSDPKSPKRTNISELVNVEWLGSNSNVTIVSEEQVGNYYSYAVKDFSNNTVHNETGVKGFQKITYKNLYNNIDVQYVIHNDGGVKYSIILHPGADASQIKLKYSSYQTNTSGEFVNLALNSAGQLEINSSLGQLIEHKPFTFYSNNNAEIASSYNFDGSVLTFNLSNYDSSQEVIIDPWIVSPTFTTSTAVWEVETDAAGNVYTIGGETPMELKKYNAAGALQWTYTSPWDTATVWLGTLATDAGGTSYITSGTSPEIERIDNAGTMQWHNASGGGFGQDTEYWTISFNCDKTKLIVGGTKFVGLTDVYAAIFDIDITNGNVITDQTFAYTNIFGGIGSTPEEVRSISSAKNAKFIYLTHNQVGAINQNFNTCPTLTPTFQVDNTHHLGYKCEDYLPETQNGGGLKALVANDNFFYTHSGNEIHQWDLNTGAQLNTVPVPGGASSTVPFIGGLVVENSGLAVDNCGNVYAGSKDRVIKYDPNLTILSSTNVGFNVYDVSVNANGEVIAVGAQSDNSNVNRNGRIESLAMSACAQYTLVCCDASFCEEDPLCESDAPFALTAATAGGTWSGPGVNPTTGVFDPAAAGSGTHTITYTLACGNESHDIVVTPCIAITGCEESNGDLTVTNGVGPYTWYEQGPVSTTSNDCIECGGTLFLGICTVTTPCTISTTGWVSSGTGTTYSPSSFPVKVVDSNGDTLVVNAAGELSPCSVTPGCVTAGPEGCNAGGYVWQYTVTAGGAIDVTSLTPAGSWSVSYDNGATWTVISAPTTLNTVGDIWILGIDPDPANAGVFASGAWNYTDCSSTPVNVSVGSDCILDGCPGCTTTGCVTVGNEGCGNGGYTWEYNLTAGATIDVTTLTPAGSWFVSYDNGVTWVPLTAPTTINTAGDVWILGVDPDPADFFVYAEGAWSFTDCSSTINNISVGSDCILDGCTSCGTTPCTPPTLSTSITDVTCTGGNDGAIDLTVTGTSTYSFSWSNSAATEDINTLTANSYTVTVTDQADATCTATTTVTVADGTQPTVVANASTTNACTGDMITLTGSGASTYTWDNGVNDGVAFAATTTTTYTVTGTDGAGCTNTDAITVTVTTCTTPSASFTASATSICEGDCIDLTNTSTNIPPGSLVGWNFPGSSTPNSTQTSPTNICYPASGSYWVTLVYSDATFALVDSTGMAIDVTVCNVDPPIADFSASLTNICEGDCIDFTDLSTSTATGGITTWAWDFGNGATSALPNPTGICYATAGTYDVELTVTDANGTHTETKTSYITVTVCAGPQPIADFSASNTTLCEGDCIDFTDLSTSSAAGGITGWSWDFGNGQTSTLQNPTGICYATAGNYTVTLIVTDANGNGTETKTSYIVVTTCVGPTASFNVVPNTTICEGDCIGFVNTSTNVPPGSFVGWNFPGATPNTSTVSSPSNICYNTAGSYWVTLVITDATFNVLDSTGVAITVTTCTPPVAGFTFSPAGPFCADSCITFTSTSTYTPTATFAWDFGNGQGNNSENPGAPICFSTAGTYQVSLTVTDANGTDTETQTIIIEDCTPPTAGVTMSSNTICAGQCISFNNSSVNGTFYQWTFEGGSPPVSYLQFPGNVCFDAEGTYTVTLVAGNSYGSDTITSQILVNPSPSVTASDDQNIVSSQETQIQAVSSDPNVTYIWSPSEWLGCPDCPVTSANPEDTTLYVITVTNQYGCSDSADVLIMVEYVEEIGVASAFSPNGDGFNDVLYVQGAGIKNMEFKIYNRYGQVVFESNDEEFGWDGTFQGKEENTGVFVYYVVYDNSTSEGNILEGNVTLIR